MTERPWKYLAQVTLNHNYFLFDAFSVLFPAELEDFCRSKYLTDKLGVTVIFLPFVTHTILTSLQVLKTLARSCTLEFQAMN